LAKNSKAHFAIVYFTINNLQEITDNYGVKPDNEAVKKMAERLQERLTKTQPDHYQVMIARRDTFIILIYPVTAEEAEGELDRIASMIDEPFTLKRNDQQEVVQLKASIGVAMYPLNGEEAEKLKMNADLTMSYAHQIAPERTRYIFCSNDTSEKIRMEAKLKRDLPKAFKNKEFFLVYQPVIDVAAGTVYGMEVLVRWQHPTLGLIPPLDFIELTERSGEIIPLGRWILFEACAQLKVWHAAGYKNLKMAINLSAKQLESTTLVEDVKRALRENDLLPKFVELEMTETAKFDADAVDALKELDKMGVNFALDDFGQGQSGLNSLNEFEFIKKIKLDRAFIKDLPHNERSKEIVINSIQLAHNLSKGQRQIKVLGEGVDKEEQLVFLKQQGIDMIQGFYFSKPITAAEFTKFLQEHPKFDIK
jgi:diguanylate cyclase (GGDEF)-like protein